MKQMRAIAAIAALLLAVSACATETLPQRETSLPVLVTSVTTATTAPETESSLCTRVDGPGCVFDHGNFDHPTLIDNEWLPMTPGTRLVFEGTTNEEDELLEHKVVITVTDLTKVIDGINSVVSWDQDFSEGVLVEAELAFFAQDNDGNVWRMGEHPEEYEDGVFVEAPTWMAGINGALAGISMLADPIVGTLSYSQGWSADVEFFDRGKVNRLGEKTCVALDCFESTLIIEEFDVEEISASQLKYFARGVGNILVDWSGDDETQEELELVAVEQLDASGLAAARAAVFELDRHASQVSPDVYGPPNAGGIRSP